MRIRTIKPSIHTDEELWDLEQETGLPLFRAFVGLWSAADREGRFEWRPRPLKAAILPYWDGDFSRVLDALTTRGFVVRYASQGRDIGLVRTFTKHQVVNNREQASVLPPPPDSPTDPPPSTRGPRVPDASVTRLVPALVEQEQEQEQEREQERRARAPVEPDSLERDIRNGFETRFVAATAASPDQLSLSKAVLRLVPWVEKTAPLRKVSEHELVTRMLDGFFANDNAKAKRFPPAYLATNPLEYLDPPAIKPLRAAASGRYAGPSRVPTAAEYAADLKEKAPWET